MSHCLTSIISLSALPPHPRSPFCSQMADTSLFVDSPTSPVSGTPTPSRSNHPSPPAAWKKSIMSTENAAYMQKEAKAGNADETEIAKATKSVIDVTMMDTPEWESAFWILASLSPSSMRGRVCTDPASSVNRRPAMGLGCMLGVSSARGRENGPEARGGVARASVAGFGLTRCGFRRELAQPADMAPTCPAGAPDQLGTAKSGSEPGHKWSEARSARLQMLRAGSNIQSELVPLAGNPPIDRYRHPHPLTKELAALACDGLGQLAPHIP